MDTDAITFNQATGHRPPDRREVLWDELERLHAQLGIDPPTATYTLEALEEEVTLARRALATTPYAADRLKVDVTIQQQASAAQEDACGERIRDAQHVTAHHRTHTTWRSFYPPLFFNEGLKPPTVYGITPSEDASQRDAVQRCAVEIEIPLRTKSRSRMAPISGREARPLQRRVECGA